MTVMLDGKDNLFRDILGSSYFDTVSMDLFKVNLERDFWPFKHPLACEENYSLKSVNGNGYKSTVRSHV